MAIRSKTIVVAALALPVVVVAGVAVFLLTLDINQYRAQITAAVRQATGRELTLSGPLRLDVGLRPTLSADDVALANAGWGTRPRMLALDHLEGQIRLLPLLSGRLEITHISLAGADLLLETNREGAGNWVLGAASETASAPLIPKLDGLTLTGSRVTYRDGVSGRETVLALQRLTVKPASISGKHGLQGDLQARWNELPLTVTVQIGALGELFEGTQPYPVDLTLHTAGLTSRIQGTVGRPRTGSGLDFKFDLKGADLTGLRPIVGPDFALNFPVQVSGRVSGNPRLIKVEDLAASLGNSDLAGAVSLDLNTPRPRIQADLSADRLDLAQLLPSATHPQAKASALARTRVFPREPLPFGVLNALDAKLKLHAKTLTAPQLRLRQVVLELSLRDGRLKLDPLRATVAGSTVNGTVSANGSADKPQIRIRLRAPGLNVARLLRETELAGTLEGTADVVVDVTGHGRSVAEMMAGLQGQARILMGRGRAQTRTIDSAVGGVTALVGMLSSGNSAMTRLNCAASAWRIKRGVATSRVMLVDTQYSTVIGHGHIDLGREKLDLEVIPKPKSVTLNASLPVKIGGTLAHPRFTPNKLSAARRIGGLLGAVLFPPAAIAAFADLGTGDDNPCLTLARRKQQATPRQSSTSTKKPKPEPSIQKRAGDIVESVGKGLQGLFGLGSNSNATQNEAPREDSR